MARDERPRPEAFCRADFVGARVYESEEYRAERQAIVSQGLASAAEAQALAQLDHKHRVYTFRATSDVISRTRDQFTLDGWDLDQFWANPVVLDAHGYDSIDKVIGRAVRAGSVWPEMDVQFSEANPRGQLAKAMVEEGTLRAVSIGADPSQTEIVEDKELGRYRRHTRKTLLELSIIPVPANWEALRVASIDGAVDQVSQAGRVLSAANEARLRDAAEAILAVLDQVAPAADATSDDEQRQDVGVVSTRSSACNLDTMPMSERHEGIDVSVVETQSQAPAGGSPAMATEESEAHVEALLAASIGLKEALHQWPQSKTS